MYEDDFVALYFYSGQYQACDLKNYLIKFGGRLRHFKIIVWEYF